MKIFDKILKRREGSPPVSSDKFYIITGSHKKHAVTSQLVEFFSSRTNSEGFLYTGYPVIGTIDGAFAIDALLVSKKYGLVAFDIVEADDLGEYKKRQDEIYNRLHSYLFDYDTLIKRRKLVVEPIIVTIAPRAFKFIKDQDYPLLNKMNELESLLEHNEKDASEYYEQLHSVIQNITSIRKSRNTRKTLKEDSRGAILKKLEDSIANLDHNQAAAVINTHEGVQRIRGLAGSGKTIVLALKVAYLHAMNPDWDIAITFNSRSLKNQFETLITRFVHERTKEEPNWSKISIIHAWGSKGNNGNKGIYYDFCKDHGEEYLDFSAAKNRFGYDDAFAYSCKVAIENQRGKIKEKYDVILVDEAQDFSFDDTSSYFLKMCYELLRAPKMLIYAYDELQSLSMRSMPNPDEIFGIKPNGEPKVTHESFSDILLHKCYRNSRPILSTAHALGFGAYYAGGLIQMFENKSIWGDVGYETTSGTLAPGQNVTLERNDDTSPKFLEELAPKDDLIEFKSFNSDDEQIRFLVEDIIKNIEVEELLCSDIMVINSDPLKTKNAVAMARKLLFDRGYNSNLAGVTTSPDIFQEENAVTFTGIYRAKGNEAGMVYVLNAQHCYSGFSLAKKRNILFTAITRSKAWVRVLGYGSNMENLIEEYKSIQDQNYKIKFTYPDEEQMKKMYLIHRDRDPEGERKIEQYNQNISGLVASLEAGELMEDDLDPRVLRKLKDALR